MRTNKMKIFRLLWIFFFRKGDYGVRYKDRSKMEPVDIKEINNTPPHSEHKNPCDIPNQSTSQHILS